METYSLFQLNEYIKRVIALNFQDAIWINAEISQVKFSRGNYYLELIQKEEASENVKAQASAIIWYRKVTFLEKKFKALFTSIIDTGNEIRIKVSVNFSERYGFSLVVEDLDASYTLGQAEMLKQDILQRLQNENLVHKNAEHVLPPVLQKIAVISSESAAGFKDFLEHLNNNSYGYIYNIDLFQSAMQGQAVENELIAALDEIESKQAYDCVVIIRGGGARLDLAAFDNYQIGKRIALFTLPVITGIGHEIDNSIADLVSHTGLKTPTAVADFLIEWNLHFESKVLDVGSRIVSEYREIMFANMQKLSAIDERIRSRAMLINSVQMRKLDEIKFKLKDYTLRALGTQDEKLKGFQSLVSVLSPKQTLKRGFSILRQNGKIIKSKKDLALDETLTTELVDGIIKSKIEK